MKAIRISHGATFVTDGHFTVRLSPTGECGISPVLYQALEWELRTEPPSSWDYLTEQEIRQLPDGGYDKVLAELKNLHEMLGSV